MWNRSVTTYFRTARLGFCLGCAIMVSLTGIPAHAQEQPFVVSPLIGDTLQPSERNVFSLFPRIPDFAWAVFYLNPDSTLRAHVSFFRNGLPADTAFDRYSTLKSLQDHIQNVRMLKRLSEKPVPEEQEFDMPDGSSVRGSVLYSTTDSIVVLSKSLGRVALRKNKMIPEDSARAKRRAPVDPNRARLFLLPTAETPRAGGGFFTLYDFCYLQGAVGVTDFLMFSGGLVIIPGRDVGQMFNLGAKVRIFGPPEGGTALAAGVQAFSMPEDNSSLAFSFLSLSSGGLRERFTFMVALQNEGGSSRNKSSALFGLGFSLQAGNSNAFVFEGYYNETWGVVPLGIGLRFFGAHFSGEVGAVVFLSSDSDFPVILPMITFCYNF